MVRLTSQRTEKLLQKVFEGAEGNVCVYLISIQDTLRKLEREGEIQLVCIKVWLISKYHQFTVPVLVYGSVCKSGDNGNAVQKLVAVSGFRSTRRTHLVEEESMLFSRCKDR